MQYSDQNNEANLGQLLFGNRSPMKLHVHLKPIDADDESLNSLNPFETINLGVGKRYILAKLSMGNTFVEKYILLNLFDVNFDNDAIKEISLMTRQGEFSKVPFPKLIDFKSGYESVGGSFYPPTFYCSKIRLFFNVLCLDCSGILHHENSSDCLYCPRCEALDLHKKRYSYYENAEADDVLLLQEVFSQYAKNTDCAVSMPCSGCKNASQCFPNPVASVASVANEFHHIIPFSYEPFSLYGISYSPLSLIEYGELVSGQKKTDLLAKLLRNKEHGRYHVLKNTPCFKNCLEEQNYLTSSNPDIFAIITIKLRVFVRICLALKNADLEQTAIAFSHSDFSMDVSQFFSAGDSYSRAELCFYPLNKLIGSPKVEGMSLVVSALSKIYFQFLYKNEKTNELLIQEAVDKLIHCLNKAQLNSLPNFEKILSELDGVSSVLCFDTLYYYGCQEKNELRVLVLELVKFGLLLTQKISADDIFSSRKISSLDDVILETNNMLVFIDTLKKRQPVINDDQALLCRALQEIIDDEDWLAAVTKTSNKKQVSPQTKESNNDKTLVLSAENNVVDKTIVMNSKGEQDSKQDDALILSSINRILRQL